MLPKHQSDKAYLKLAQFLATADIESILCEKYAERILHKERNINFQVSANTFLGRTKPELLGCTVLHLAYKKNKLKLFNLLLLHGADFNLQNRSGCTVLHKIIEDTYKKEPALRANFCDNPFVTSVLDRLVISGNPCNPGNEKQMTHVHIACMANHMAAVEHFLKNKVYINQVVAKNSSIFPGYSALHIAVSFSNLDTIKMLLDYGAAYKVRDAKGLNPLHIVIKVNIEIADRLNKNEFENTERLTIQRKTNEDIIHLLLHKSGGNMDVIDDNSLSRLHIACVLESSQITDDLLGDAAYINRAVSHKSTPFSGNTALHFAALCNVEKVKLLLAKGANIHLKNVRGQTAMDLCTERYKIQDIKDIISSQPDWSTNGAPCNRKTLLDLVLCLQTGDLSPFLVKQSFLQARVGRKSLLWPTYDLLHLAVIFSERNCKSGSIPIEKVAQHSGPAYPTAKGRVTPLHLAFRSKKAGVVALLLTACRSAVNFVDTDKLSHLHVACAAGDVNMVKKLLLNGADVNASVQASFEWFRHPQPDASLSKEVLIPKGATPLHIAVIVGNCEMVKLLAHHGAEIYAEDECGMTPIHWLVVSDNPVSPAADVLLTSRPISITSSADKNKRLATSSTLKECFTNTGLTHLHVACLANNLAAVEQLLAVDLSPSSLGRRFVGVDAEKFPGSKWRYIGYPFHFALESKSKEIVRLLIEHEADVLTMNPITKSIPLFDAFAKSSPCSDVLVSVFKSNKALQERLEKDFGLTMLHFYCSVSDDRAAESLLMDGTVDVNRFVSKDSPIWPGFTPLHVLIKFYENTSRSADTLLYLLLCYGADVMALNAENNSPLHLAYELDAETSLKSFLLKTLLRSQKNCSINPRNRAGLTHFHVACVLGDIVAMENFFKHKIDVNEPIDCFYTDTESRGCTPLHLVLFHPLNGTVKVERKHKAVVALIRYGADVRAENELGNTPLHLTAKYHSSYIDLIKKIVEAGADIHSSNIFSQTPFELLLGSKDVTVAGIQFFLDRGCYPNVFNPITQKGFLTADFPIPAFEIFMKLCGKGVDEMGRTIIHNVVSTSSPDVSDEFYIEIIESLVNVVDIDRQCRTALHVATQIKNHRAVFALLQAGADTNIIDANKKTAFVYAFETLPFSEGSQDDSDKIVKTFSSHVQKFNVCMLDVHEMNHSALVLAFRNYNVDAEVTQSFYDELEEMKKVKIESSSITLLDFISGTCKPSVSCSISHLKRSVIDSLFETIDKTRFCESLGIIRSQCRKVSKSVDC